MYSGRFSRYQASYEKSQESLPATHLELSVLQPPKPHYIPRTRSARPAEKCLLASFERICRLEGNANDTNVKEVTVKVMKLLYKIPTT